MTELVKNFPKLTIDWVCQSNLIKKYKIIDNSKTADPVASLNQIKIIAFKEKDEWELAVKYNIGKK